MYIHGHKYVNIMQNKDIEILIYQCITKSSYDRKLYNCLFE